MKKIYTCYNCAFPFALEDSEVPEYCPACNAPRSQFLEEPWNGSIEARRIHVDFPKPDPNRDPMDITFHHPKDFPPHSMHGRLRRFVLGYDDAKATREFFTNALGWDIIDVENTDPEQPLMYCATGPGNDNWEPKFPSFGYGFLKSRKTDDTGRDPRIMIEVDSIPQTLEKVVEFGGKVIKGQYEVNGEKYAVVEDGEGNAMYIWQTPDTVTWTEPETQYLSRRPE